MLQKDDYYKAGVINKPKGVMGEVNFACIPNISLPNDFYDFFFLEIDGYLVPFKVEEINWNADNRGSVKFEDVETNEQAAKITGYPFYVPAELMNTEDTDSTFESLIGFNIFNEEKEFIGEVTDFMDIPGNPVLVINKGKEEILIPFNEDLLIHSEPKEKTMHIKIPEGLI